jgi:hypothetical protein
VERGNSTTSKSNLMKKLSNLVRNRHHLPSNQKNHVKNDVDIAIDQGQIGQNKGLIRNDNGRIAKNKGPIAKNKGPIAKNKGPIAKNDIHVVGKENNANLGNKPIRIDDVKEIDHLPHHHPLRHLLIHPDRPQVLTQDVVEGIVEIIEIITQGDAEMAHRAIAHLEAILEGKVLLRRLQQANPVVSDEGGEKDTVTGTGVIAGVNIVEQTGTTEGTVTTTIIALDPGELGRQNTKNVNYAAFVRKSKPPLDDIATQDLL